MVSGWLFTDDIGESVKIEVKEKDLAGATSVEILVLNPDKENVTWDAVPVRREKDPKFIDVTHIIKEGDIDKPGRYLVSVSAKTPDGEILIPSRTLWVYDRQKGRSI
ncbi:MAG: hypothetical protein WB392_04990 [Methanotrichaceae archaeon]